MRTRVFQHRFAAGGASLRLRRTQRGVSLLEVMIAVLVLAVGVLGAASLQINAIRYHASAGYSTQASLIANDVLDRMRANAGDIGSYALASVEGECSAATVSANIISRDLADFSQAISCRLPEGSGSIAVSGNRATVTVGWSEARTVADGEHTLFMLSSVIR